MSGVGGHCPTIEMVPSSGLRPPSPLRRRRIENSSYPLPRTGEGGAKRRVREFREPNGPLACIAREGWSVGGRLLDEQRLIERAKQGDQDAYEVLVRQYQDIAFRTAYLITRSAAEAEDATQD